MTTLTTRLGSETRRAVRRKPVSIAGVFAVVCGCTGRLAVSDGLSDIRSDAGAGGTSASNETTRDAAPAIAASCPDGALNGEESDLDCGGPDCPPCEAQASCAVHTDCQSGSCRAGLCRAPACDDGVKNGHETSVDCGGTTCPRCASKTCNCASSPELTALGCDETNGPIFPGGPPLITPDGEVAVFFMCHLSVVVPGAPPCTSFRWTSSGAERIADLGAYAMSRDGRKILLQASEGWSLYDRAGQTTPVPLQDQVLLSADGTKVVDINVLDSGATVLQRWSEQAGVETLAEFMMPGLLGSFEVSDSSSDASSIVGYVETEVGDVGFLWTDAGGLITLGPLPEDARGLRPGAVSEDGSVVVGVTTTFAAQSRMIFRWTSDGLQTLAPAEPGNQSPYVDTTPDGAVTTATIAYPESDSLSAWRFSAAEGVNILSTTSPGVVRAMTPDGSIFIGTEAGDPVKWVSESAVPGAPRQFTTVRLSSALQARGVDLTGWEIREPTAISDDGRVTFGYGSCGGVQTIYRHVSEP